MGFNLETELPTIPNINALLSDEERQARLLLIDKIIMNGNPVKPSEINDNNLIQGLGSKGVIVQEEDGAVSVVYPVSAMPTPHRVTLKDGRSFYSICAVDSLGSAFVFQQDIAITSSCSHCHKPISVEIENGEISTFDPADIFVTHTDLVGEVNWAGTCWGLMNFFCMKGHLMEWQSNLAGNSKKIHGLNLADALIVAKRIFE